MTSLEVMFLCCYLVAMSDSFCDPMDGSLPGSSVHGISQARILEWVAISSHRDPPCPKDGSRVSCLADGLFTAEPPGKPVMPLTYF